jgi:arsenate reductase-like glutaredoxin family protein
MLRIYGVEGCGPCEVTKMFLRSKQVPFEFVDVARAPDKRRELKEKLGSPTSGVILEDGDRLSVMQGVSVAKLNRYLSEYQARHSAD